MIKFDLPSTTAVSLENALITPSIYVFFDNRKSEPNAKAMNYNIIFFL